MLEATALTTEPQRHTLFLHMLQFIQIDQWLLQVMGHELPLKNLNMPNLPI